MDEALTRLYSALFTVGFFDGSERYGGLDFSDVGTPEANQLAYDAAVRGMTLLKNDNGLLPLTESNITTNVAVIGKQSRQKAMSSISRALTENRASKG